MTRKPVWKQQGQSIDIAIETMGERFQGWLKSNRVLISAISAFIVLGSFGLKESIEDSGRTLEDAAKEAQVNSIREQDKEQLLGVLKTIVSQTDAATAPSGKDRNQHIQSQQAARAIDRLFLSNDRAKWYCS